MTESLLAVLRWSLVMNELLSLYVFSLHRIVVGFGGMDKINFLLIWIPIINSTRHDSAYTFHSTFTQRGRYFQIWILQLILPRWNDVYNHLKIMTVKKISSQGFEF